MIGTTFAKVCSFVALVIYEHDKSEWWLSVTRKTKDENIWNKRAHHSAFVYLSQIPINLSDLLLEKDDVVNE